MTAFVERASARFLAILAAVAVVLAGILLAVAPASAAGDGSISGTVSDDTGARLADVTVIAELYDASSDSWVSVNSATTTDDGSYTVSGLDDGAYRVSFSPPTSDLLSQYWNGVTSADDATTVQVAGGPVTDIDASLNRAGGISGTVTDHDGTPVAGVVVTAYPRNIPGYSDSTPFPAQTFGDGVFQISGLPAGDYTVQYTTQNASESVLGEWWDDATSQDSANLVSVDAGTTTTGIDAQLASASSISGIVTDASGDPVEGVDVIAYVGGDDPWSWTWGSDVGTDADGSFHLQGLTPGTYKLEFSTDNVSANVVSEWWNDAPSMDSATPITLAAATDLTGIDPQLAAGATITGTVVDTAGQPLAGENVTASSDAGVSQSATTDENGAYTISRLPSGSYRVGFFDWAQTYVTSWWDHTTNWTSATLLNVTAGQTVDHIDGVMARASAVQGTVTDAAGQPVSDVTVWAYDAAGIGTGAQTDADGHYAITPLSAGTYTLYFDTSRAGANVASGWWQNATGASDATRVTVGEGATVSDISPRLGPGASISGHVTDGADASLPDTMVLVYKGDDTDDANQVWTDIDGNFSARGLGAGTYRVQYMSTDQTNTTLTEWWNNAQTRAAAEPIVLTTGQAVAHIDAKLSVDDHSVRDTHTGSLSGVVRDAGGRPLANVQVAVMDAAGRFGDGTATNADGQWSFGGLSVHSYKVSFTATIDGKQVVQYWKDATDFDSATAIALTDGEHRTGIDGVLGDRVLADIPLAATPTITGSAKNGQKLTVATGKWTKNTSFSYQWLADGNPIAGATSKTLVLSAKDVGAKISVRVTGSLNGFTDTVRTSKAVGPVAPAKLTASTPVVVGSAVVGSKLRAKAGTWTKGAERTYQWLANGTPIDGATAPTFTVGAAQLGKKLSVRVTGTLAGYTSATKTSSPTEKVQPGKLVAGTPSISGGAVVGGTVTAKPGTWTPGAELDYQWYADGTAIAKATTSTYRIPSSLVGKKLSVGVTGSLAGYASVTKSSGSTAKVAPGR